MTMSLAFWVIDCNSTSTYCYMWVLDLRKAHEAQSPTRPNPLMGWVLGPVLRPTEI
jgi:hypothetical protein